MYFQQTVNKIIKQIGGRLFIFQNSAAILTEPVFTYKSTLQDTEKVHFEQSRISEYLFWTIVIQKSFPGDG